MLRYFFFSILLFLCFNSFSQISLIDNSSNGISTNLAINNSNSDITSKTISKGATKYYNVTILWPTGRNSYDTYQFECPDDVYILDEAEKHGIALPYGSRVGVDFTSAGFLVSGTVDNSDQTLLCDSALDQCFILLDTSYPTSDCVIKSHMEIEANAYWMNHCQFSSN